LNGKKFAWQGVALLPFVDEKRLFKAIKPYYSQLTEEEGMLKSILFVFSIPHLLLLQKNETPTATIGYFWEGRTMGSIC
jgi:5'-3' exonuclease